MKTSLLFLAIFLIVVNTVNGQSCRDLFAATDECLRKILYIGDNDMTFVKNETLLNNHCKEIKSSYQCLKRFGKCLKLFPKQVFVMTMRSAKKMIKERCELPKGRKDFLKHTQCLSYPEVYDFNRCVDKGVLIMKYISANASTEELIPATCCAFQDIAECLKRKGDQYCLHRTGPDTGNYIAGVARKVGSDLIELACRSRDTLEGCRKVESKWMKKFDEIGNPFEKIKPQKNSLFNPLIILAERLDSPL